MTPNYQFFEIFGHIGCLVPDCRLTYEKVDTNELFKFLENITESEIEKLMQKSVKDKHDYIFDIAKNNKSEYQEGCIY